MRNSIITITILLTLFAMTGCAGKSEVADQSFSDFVNGDQNESTLTAAQHEQVGDGHVRRGNNEMAFIHYNEALTLDPESHIVRVKKGDLLIIKGLDEQALAEFNKVLTANPDHAMANASAGTVYFRAGLYTEARLHLEKAIRLNPMLWKAHNYLGILNDRDGNYEVASSNFSTAIALHRGNNISQVYNNLGVVNIARKEYDLAIDAFRQALSSGDVSSRTYNNLGLALARQGRLEEALESFSYAGGEAKANNNLGYVLLANEEPAKAVPYFERAIELSPNFYVKAADNLKRARLAARFQKVAVNQQSGSTPNPLHRQSFPDSVQNPGESAASPASADSPSRDIEEVSLGTDSKDIEKVSHITGSGDSIIPTTKTYGLHVSSFRHHDRAFKDCAKLRKKGFDTWINQVDLGKKGIWYRVLVGSFASVDEARANKADVIAVLGLKSATVKSRVMPAPDGSHL